MELPLAPAGAECWICLEDGTAADSSPLLRNCACRGDSGYAHVRCLAQYASRKSEELFRTTVDASSATSDPWRKCANCKQMHGGAVQLALADAAVESVRHLPESELRRVLTITVAGHCRMTSGDFRGAISLYEEIMAILRPSAKSRRRSVDELSYPEDLQMVGPRVELECLVGLVMSHTNSQETPPHNMAAYYLDKAHALWKNHFSDEDEPEDMDFIQFLREGIRSYESLAKPSIGFTAPASHMLEEMRREYGNEDGTTIMSALAVAGSLRRENKKSEALRLVDEFLPISTRCLGPSHQFTIWLECEKTNILAGLNDQVVVAASSPAIRATLSDISGCCSEYKGKEVQVLRAAKEKNKYIILVPEKVGGESKKFKIDGAQVFFPKGTPVVCRDFVSECRLNGESGKIRAFYSDMGRYQVDFDNANLSPCLAKPENVAVVFP